MAYDSILIDGECSASGVPARLVIDAVSLNDLTLEVTQERERDAYVLLETLVGSVAVYADA